MALIYGSAFSGIGGIDLGFDRAGMSCAWQIEIDPFARRVLSKHWPDVPKYEDITKITGSELQRVDVIAGGFPCQDLSVAGKQAGIRGKRSGLFFDLVRIVRALRPRYLVLENVPNLLSGPDNFGAVLGELAESGYDAEWQVFSAAGVGAPHLRKRVIIVAYSAGEFWDGCGTSRGGRSGSPDRCSALSNADGLEHQGDSSPIERSGAQELLPHANRERLAEREIFGGDAPEKLEAFTRGSRAQWATEPDVGRVAHGVPSRVDRLRGLGNAVVPQLFEFIGRLIIEHAEATG